LLQWGVVAGRTWELLEGLDQGQTQLDCAPEGEMVVWSHPVDLHYACRGLTGWPKLHFQIWSQDVHGRNDICACQKNAVLENAAV
jgi:B9 domain-containing protein 2